ncbi:MAG: protein kinase [Dermatophilaceae bacterium]|nr:protein kinase [Actinomycetales bacterium]MBP8880202.1 protein kinase [Dermatophilaceae bacterium]MBP9917517.1 protein kinase [Dermatophilaceae bacterium]
MSARCAQPGCAGTILDGYCDVCGSPGSASPQPAAAAPAAAKATAAPAPSAAQPAGKPAAKSGGRCTQSGCSGSILDGYCDVCGSAAGSAPAAPAPASGASAAAGPGSSGEAAAGGESPVTSPVSSTRSAASNRLSATVIGSARARSGGSKTTRRLTSSSQRMRSARLGAGLTSVPPMPLVDASTAVMADPVVPEDKRFCSACGTKVGRSTGDKPGRTTGFCPKCRQAFSFDPKLKKGDLVAGQYEVAGCLAHGGLGWIYLAKDRNVSDRWVVLKGLLNSGDPDALAAAIAEQRFLAQVEHPHIVEIYNFVTFDGAGYIVMEYVGGTSLKAVLKQRMRKTGSYDPLPVDQALAYIVEILPAFQYLHDLGLAYCDFKPDNLIQVGDDLKLIDLGGVRRLDDQDSAIFGTVGYQAPEVAKEGVSVASDIYTIGRTLVVLTSEFRGYQTTYVDSLPPTDQVPAFARYDSFYRLVLKACASSPDDRFASADEMRVQMLGVLREVVAQDAKLDRATTSATSRLFEDPAISSDVLDWWSLPLLRPDPHDPQAAFVADVRSMAAHERPDALRSVEPSAEVRIELARSGLQRSDPGLVSLATSEMLRDDPWEWRAVWLQGLAALASRDAKGAQSSFNAVYGQVPGELAPKLALAFACEVSGEPDVAESLYAVCARTDTTYTAVGAFGMARIRLLRKDIDGTLTALDLVPPTSRAYGLARQKRAQVLAQHGADFTQLGLALRSVEGVPMEPADKAALEVSVFERALAKLTQEPSLANPGVMLPGAVPATTAGIRTGLETAYRKWAQATPDPALRIELVDKANTVRPWTIR